MEKKSGKEKNLSNNELVALILPFNKKKINKISFLKWNKLVALVLTLNNK